MIVGNVNACRETVIPLVVRDVNGSERELETLVDTGFSSFLTLPPALIAALGLPFRRQGRALLADGSEILSDIYEATVFRDGRPRRVSVATADTNLLVGMRLLQGYELTVQVAVGGSVRIEALP